MRGLKRKLIVKSREVDVLAQDMPSSNIEWYALYTKPRHEKLVETELNKKGVAAFTPKKIYRKRWSDRVVIIEEPLFKGYCFAQFSLQHKMPIITQKGVVTIVNFNHGYIPVPVSVIQSLKILLENKVPIDPFPYLQIGNTVVVKYGPLQGLEGMILEKRNNNMRLVISIDAIASSIQCIVDTDSVELS
jgi:transcription antitermination factor NusG